MLFSTREQSYEGERDYNACGKFSLVILTRAFHASNL